MHKSTPAMKALTTLWVLILPIFSFAQQIDYSDPQEQDGRRTNFEIIGKMNGNILVFVNNHSENAINVFDDDMKLVNRVRLDFLPERYLNLEFIAYADFAYLIYEFQRKNIVHVSAVKIDPQGNRMGAPVDLDTTQVGFAANNKIYSIVFSEDKQRIMVFKINSKNPRVFVFTSFLFDKQLELLDRHRIALDMQDHNELFSSFLLDDEGQLVFARYERNAGTIDYVSRVSLISKGATADSFSVKDIGTNDRILDEIKIKIDNQNKRYILTGFYYNQKRGDIQGVYSVLWDKLTDSKVNESVTIFNDQLRAQAKSSESNLKMAFNDYFIKNIIVLKSGGYLLVSESEFTTSRGIPYNRYDYMYGYSPYGMGPMDYYNPGSPYRYGYSATRYNAEGILVLSFDKNNNLEWNSVIPKTQFDDESENLISHHIMNTGGELHFLYNQYERRTTLLTDQSLSPDGKLTRYPTLKNLDKGFDFMPRFGKQISSTEILMPCLYRNYLCFAKIEF
jgi:hypothetical protein